MQTNQEVVPLTKHSNVWSGERCLKSTYCVLATDWILANPEEAFNIGFVQLTIATSKTHLSPVEAMHLQSLALAQDFE